MSLAKPVSSLVLLAALAIAAHAQTPISSTAPGQLLGEIKNTAGVSQMGATVLLYNRYDQVVRRALSDQNGRFALDGLAPGMYTLRVTLASFIPVLRQNIAVLAGTGSLLRISLANVFSTVEFASPQDARAALMSDEWKWVLRSSQATRPILRFQAPPVRPSTSREATAVFADTNGMVKVSAGDGSLANGAGQQNVGTAFAVETSVYGGNKVRVSGNLGYGAASGLPSAGFRTTYASERGPQMSLTVRQAYFPANVGSITSGNTPVLRTASLSSMDSVDLADVLHLEYGASLDSVSLFGKMNFFSPFARATYDLGDQGAVKLAYSSGAQPVDLLARQAERDPELDRDLTALTQLPRLSRRDNHAAVERIQNYEAGYEWAQGATRIGASVFREDVRNAAFLMSGADFLGSPDLLPDLNSRGTLFNLGDYQRSGYGFSAIRGLSEDLEFAVAAGRAGALVADAQGLAMEDGDDVRSHVRKSARGWVTVRASGHVRFTGTRLSAGYGWTDFRSLMPTHVSLTGQTSQQIGWNASLRQPLPAVGGVRMELNAEMRNALAQGYLAVDSPDGHRAVFTNAPRALRGGLTFIF